MKNRLAKMFNKKASDPKNKSDQIIEAINLKEGQNVADIGSGGGYFSLRFAVIVGEKGKVYPVDTKSKFLEFIKNNAKEKGLNNIKPTLVSEDRLDLPCTIENHDCKSVVQGLPEKSLDFIFMRNVTHHIPNRVKYFRNLKNFIKPDGKIIIIEYKKGKSFTFHRIFGHNVSKEIIIKEMEKAGYLLEKEFDFLPEQHFTIYSRK